jgi:hypothetical protein
MLSSSAGLGDWYIVTAMFDDSLEIVIQGVTASGQPFRPSDWAERLCGMMSVFGEDRHLSYSPYLKPIIAAGVRCVVVDVRLEETDPAAYRFLLDFAKDNELKLRPGRTKKRPEEAAADAPASMGGNQAAV